ncbi:MAG: transporter [Acidobacteriota bacterium]
MVTESPDTVAARHLRLELGAEWLQDAVFPLSGLGGNLTRFGVFGLRFGLGDAAEVELQGVAQDRLSIERRHSAPHSPLLDFSGHSTSDFGDLILGTKFRFVQEHETVPALAFRFAVEIPNASNESGLGNDETNAYAAFIAGKKFGKARVNGNLGLAILGDPLDAGAQDDMLTYGLSGIYEVSPKANLVADFYGRTGPGGVGTEEQSRLRAGVQIKSWDFSWDVAVLAGFRSTDPAWGVVFGLSRAFKIE